MQIPLEDIKIKKRIRADLGDLTSLVESLRRFGQMQPILVDKKNVLVAGRRRFEAAKILGWRTINAQIIEAKDELSKIELELEENLQRQNLTEDEIIRALKKINKLKHPGLLRRIWNAIVALLNRLFNRE